MGAFVWPGPSTLKPYLMDQAWLTKRKTLLLILKGGELFNELWSTQDKTKSYFWVNAFIREFIATIVSEKKTHIKVILFLFLILLGILFLMYYFR